MFKQKFLISAFAKGFFLDFSLRNLGSDGVWSNLVVVYLDNSSNSFLVFISLHLRKEGMKDQLDYFKKYIYIRKNKDTLSKLIYSS